MGKLAEFLKGNRGKWVLGAAAVVVLLGVVAMRRNQSAGAMNLAEYPTYTNASNGSAAGSVSQGEVQEMVGSLSRDVGNAIKTQQDQNTKLAQQFGDSLASTQSSFAQMFGAYSLHTQAQLSGLQGAYEDQIAGLTSTLNQSLLAQAQTKLSTGYQQPFVDETHRTVYGSSTPYTGGNASTGAAQPIYGYGGVEYDKADAATKKAVEANEARLKSDASFVEAEKVRTAAVIAERQKAGKDISEQLAYQQKLSKAG